MKRQQGFRDRIVLGIIIFSLIAADAGFASNNTTLAIIKKVTKDVTKKTPSTDPVEASSGDILSSGDQVKTGKKAFALIKFTDNSIVRLREQSILTMTGEPETGGIIKSVGIAPGSLGFNIQKQRKDKFRLTTPTSVASIRGTKGKWSGGDGYDTLIVIEGVVYLKNLATGKEIEVSGGFIGFSDENQNLYSRKATEEELTDADLAVDGEAMKELKLELQDPEGNKKELKLRYRQ